MSHAISLVSHVMCNILPVTCQASHFSASFFNKLVELVGGGYVGYSLEQAQVVGIVGIVGMVGMVGIVGINK